MSEAKDTIEFWSGQLLELLIPDKGVFFTQLIQHEPNLLIQRPVNRKNIPMFIKNGMPITVYFHDNLQGLCTFESKIYHQNQQMIIDKPSINSIKKAQRRRFFRVQVAAEMRLVLSSIKQLNEVENIMILTHDISGGGVSFLFPHKVVEVGDTVKGILYLKTNSNQKIVEFNGGIVNVMKLQNQFFKISVQFIEMNETVRSDIIKFCMYKQIELRNKVGNA